MNNTDKVYLIKWVGPFSYDELYNWEKKWLENNNENFNLYLLQGKRKYARKFSYYCGQTIRCVYRRLKDRDHHFKEIEHSDYSIWIGKFSNVVPNKTDINVVEKIITSEILHPDSVCDILRSIVEISRSRRVWAKTFLIRVAV